MNRHGAQMRLRDLFPLSVGLTALAILMVCACSTAYGVNNDFLGPIDDLPGEKQVLTDDSIVPISFVLQNTPQNPPPSKNLFLEIGNDGTISRGSEVVQSTPPVDVEVPQGVVKPNVGPGQHQCEVCDGAGKLSCPHCGELLRCLHCGGDGVCEDHHHPPTVTLQQAPLPQNCAGGQCYAPPQMYSSQGYYYQNGNSYRGYRGGGPVRRLFGRLRGRRGGGC